MTALSHGHRRHYWLFLRVAINPIWSHQSPEGQAHVDSLCRRFKAAFKLVLVCFHMTHDSLAAYHQWNPASHLWLHHRQRRRRWCPPLQLRMANSSHIWISYHLSQYHCGPDWLLLPSGACYLAIANPESHITAWVRRAQDKAAMFHQQSQWQKYWKPPPSIIQSIKTCD